MGKALLMMTHANRREIGARAFAATGEIISEFVMAYEFPQERYYHFKRLCAKFEVLKIDLREIHDGPILQSPHPETHETPENIRFQIFELVAKIDDAIGRWKSRVIKQASPAPADAGSSKN